MKITLVYIGWELMQTSDKQCPEITKSWDAKLLFDCLSTRIFWTSFSPLSVKFLKSCNSWAQPLCNNIENVSKAPTKFHENLIHDHPNWQSNAYHSANMHFHWRIWEWSWLCDNRVIWVLCCQTQLQPQDMKVINNRVSPFCNARSISMVDLKTYNLVNQTLA